jgi:hypothetical protein
MMGLDTSNHGPNEDNYEVPELFDGDDEDSNSESGDTLLGDDEELEELDNLLNDSDDSLKPQVDQRVPLRRTARSNAGIKWYDLDYEWSLMNLSVDAAIRGFGDMAVKACKEELVQLFMEMGGFRS